MGIYSFCKKKDTEIKRGKTADVCDDDDASTEKSTYEHGNGLHATGLVLYNTTTMA